MCHTVLDAVYIAINNSNVTLSIGRLGLFHIGGDFVYCLMYNVSKHHHLRKNLIY